MGSPRDAMASLAKVAVAYTFDPSGTGPIITGAKETAAWIVTKLPKSDHDRYEKIESAVKKSLVRLATKENVQPSAIEAAISTVENLLGQYRLAPDILASLNFDPERAATVVLSGGANLLTGLNQAETDLCERMVREFYRILLLDSKVLIETEHAFRRCVIDRLDEIRRLPDEIASALERRAAASLISDPGLPWMRSFAPSSLLRAEYCAVQFHGRDKERNDIEDWCDLDQPICVRLYTGPGGMGKSRLFIEMCRNLKGKWPAWHAGFLETKVEQGRFWLMDNLLRDYPRLFVVFDSAESKPDEVVALIWQALPYTSSGYRLRVILLARQAGNWWSILKRAEYGVGDLLSGSATEQRALPPLQEERQKTFRIAAESFAVKIPGAHSNVQPPDLRMRHFQRVLFIHMAALAAVQKRRIWEAEELLNFILDRERNIWRANIRAEGLPDTVDAAVGQAAALTTLAGGASDSTLAHSLMAGVPLLAGRSADVVSVIATLLHDLYPGEGWLNGIEPDLLGEHLVAEEIEKAPGLLEATFSAGLKDGQLANALTILTRLASSQEKKRLEAALQRVPDAPAHGFQKNAGVALGYVLADALIRSDLCAKLFSERLGQLRRTVLYSGLPRLPGLLGAIYEVLKNSASKLPITLDEIYTDSGMALRREGKLTAAVTELNKASAEFQHSDARWRYERAYVAFLRGTQTSLRQAEVLLRTDIEGPLTAGKFINCGLYAKVLARHGELKDAYQILDRLYKKRSGISGEDVKRWWGNIAAHRHEFACGLVASDKLDPDKCSPLLADLEKEIARGFPYKGDYNFALHHAIASDAVCTKERVQTSLESHKVMSEKTQEQRASYLALKGAACEAQSEWHAARAAYREARGLPPELDNRRGIDWANERWSCLGETVTKDLLIAAVRKLLPVKS